MLRIKTHDIIPYIYDKFGNPIQEDESFTVKWVDQNIDKFGNKVIKKPDQDSVFDQLTDYEFEIIMYRLNKLNKLNPSGLVKTNSFSKSKSFYKKCLTNLIQTQNKR